MIPSRTGRCPNCAIEVRPAWKVCPACECRLDSAETVTRTAPHSDSSSSSPASMEEGRFPAGTVLAGRYRILGLLGRGGMGEVYRAYDLILNQAVALKFLAGAKVSDAALARFRNEVRIARQVSHANVCRVYDIGFVEGSHFLSMEYLDGEDLASLIRRIGRLPQDKAIEFARKMCAGLAAAHERGVLHRDLKPANVMIDGRGEVRITDFGLAALAEEIPLSDMRSGTPAYMSPEQKSGKEVTARSDLYSLGLVLFEMFTGKRRSETQSDPGELVKDLDPAIERLILHCLEQDPKRRPPSALHVAMALPGADPIAAALAAGETPSPEMVAASTEKEGFTPRTAIALLSLIVIALAVGARIAPKTTLPGRAPLDLPPDALAFKAQDILRQLGYSEPPRRTAYGFDCCPPNFPEFLSQYNAAQRDLVLATHRPPIIYFWYRQHRDDFLADQLLPGLGPRRLAPIPRTATVTLNSPANSEPGMIQIILDAKGRLVRLEVRPWIAGAAPAPALDAAVLWNVTGLDPGRFQRAAAREIPPMAFDADLAWTGTYSPDRPEAVRVEAAWWKGRPVFLNVGRFQASEQAQQKLQPSYVVGIALFLVVLVGSAITARQNLRLGRGDRKGAAKLAAAWFLIVTVVWAEGAQHVARPWELAMLIIALSWATFTAGTFWLLYIAIEPHIRRHWPDALISWTRFHTGRFRNPLVASHILAGLASAVVLEWMVVHPFRILVAGPPEPSAPMVLATFAQLILFRVYIGFAAIFFAMALLLLVVLIRLLVRTVWVADLLACCVFGLAGFGAFSTGVARNAGAVVFGTLIIALGLWVFRRLGLLSFLTGFAGIATTRTSPMLFNAWFGGFAFAVALSIVGVAAWCVWVIVAAHERQRGADDRTGS